MFSSAAAYKNVGPTFTEFPLQILKCTDLLNRSFWVVRRLGNMESVLINPQAYVSSQVFFHSP